MAETTTHNDTAASTDPLKTAGTGAEQGAGPASEEERRTSAQRIREEANRLSQQAGERARSYADEGKARATNALGEFSGMMRDAAGSVDERLGPEYGRYARSAADSIESFARSLDQKQVDELLDDARDFVRKSPAVAIGVAAAIGFALARVVKSGLDDTNDQNAPGA